MTWHLFQTGEQTHVIPADDLREHLRTPECWCEPTKDPDCRWVLIHGSKDGRELLERPQ